MGMATMEYDGEALDFLLPGVMRLRDVQARRVLFDQQYDVGVPRVIGGNDGKIEAFWSQIESNLQKVKVARFQTVEITVCFLQSSLKCSGRVPFATTHRSIYLPIVHQDWSHFRAIRDCQYGLPADLRKNRIRVGRLKRILIRSLPGVLMPAFWHQRPYLDFPLFEVGFQGPDAGLLENMRKATDSDEVAESDRFTMRDVEVLKQELDPEAWALLTPEEYLETPSTTPQKNITVCENFRQQLPKLADAFSFPSKLARIIEIFKGENNTRILRFDYPFACYFNPALPTGDYGGDPFVDAIYGCSTGFICQDDTDLKELENLFSRTYETEP